jgi:hypothetical protein
MHVYSPAKTVTDRFNSLHRIAASAASSTHRERHGALERAGFGTYPKR